MITLYTMEDNNSAKIVSYTRDEKGKVTNYHTKDMANTIHTSSGSGGNTAQFVIEKQRIRCLTERECFRLMGVRDCDIDKIQSVGISRTQQYKLAGNSIVADGFLTAIFKSMFTSSHEEVNRPQQRGGE